ncbi:hypothetical protein SAMN06265222_11146 [Neorhodopirellula lusitana]|uniref:Uncharacterized protein n=1 Tax=Neorhodopirellula lusitana TaxID=445327 RepID=A0ABY1QFY1_9BACT|nr:hypothetical protein SAMN06265222_11146 [Neorhodopirellula lusitana]
MPPSGQSLQLKLGAFAAVTQLGTVLKLAAFSKLEFELSANQISGNICDSPFSNWL